MTTDELLEPRRSRQSLRNRLVVSMLALALLGGLAMGAIFVAVSSTIAAAAEHDSTAQRIKRIEEDIHLALFGQEAFVLDFAVTREDRALKEFEDAVRTESASYIELARLAPADAEMRAAADQVRALAETWRETFAKPFLDQVAELPAGRLPSGGLGQSEELFAPIEVALVDLEAIDTQREAAAQTELRSAVDELRSSFALMALGLAALVIAASIWLLRSISAPLHRLSSTAQALVAGDEVTFVAEADDEIGALAVVLEQLRLDAASRYHVARVEAETAATFNQLAELTSFAQNEETLVEAATRVLRRIAPSPRGHVMLLNNSTNRLIVAAAWGDGEPAVGAPAEIDRPDRCPGIRRATAYVADDLSDDLAVRCPAHPSESGSVVCLPMPALGSIVGVIHLERPTPGSFDAATVSSAARTAEQVALALANARLMKTMEGLANTDPLTGLRNARFFDTYLEQQFALAEREKDSIGLILLDVDNFKQFNDTYGHPAGDEALRTLARTMRSVLRASDVVARYGGEEFVIGLHHAKLADVHEVAEKLRAAVEQAVVEIGPGRYGRITVSLGIVATESHRVDRKVS